MIYRCCALLAAVLIVANATAREPIRLANNPALSPDGAVLAFDWNGDVWSVPTVGGVARQLTLQPGRSREPKFSPDGKSLAFVSDRDGNAQVYIMPASGGPARQITFHTAGFTLHGWTPDGAKLLISSQRDNFWRHAERFFLVGIDKRAAEEMLFDDYGSNGALSPDGKKLLFTREGPAWWRKGYRGSQAAQVWCYDLEQKKFDKLAAHEAGCSWPLWKADGAGFYYVSGRNNAFNLWEQNLADSTGKPLTKYADDGVVFPCISRDGGTIVFRNLFDLYRLRPGESPQRIEILLDNDRHSDRVERRQVTSAAQVAFSNDGLEIAMIAGGDLWVMDTELREPKQITATAEEERSPVFSPEGDSILFASDRDGRCELFRAKRGDPKKFWWQNEKFTIERLTQDGEQKSSLSWSPDGSHVAFIKGRGELCVMTPDGKTVRTFLKSFQRPEFDWSPDGKWLVYSADDDDFNRDIFIAPIDGSRPPFNVSRHPRNDSNPVWSPDGRAIAFTGQRGEERDIFYVWLRAEDDEKGSRDRSIEKAIEKMKKRGGRAAGSGERSADAAEGKSDDAKPSAPTKKQASVVIDWDRLHDRIHRIDNPGVTESDLFWSADSKKLLFSATVNGERGTWSVEIPDDLKSKAFMPRTLAGARWLSKGNQVVGLSGGLPFAVAIDPLSGRPRTSASPTPTPAAAAAPGPRGRGRIADAPSASAGGESGGLRFTALQTVDVPKKNAAAFDLAWRTMRDNYYDERLGNRDWTAIRAKYIDAATAAPDTEGLATVINLMLGELNGSHLGFYAGIRDITQRRQPGQTDDPPAGKWREATAHFGARFDPTYPGPGLKVRDVIAGSPAEQKRSKLNPGDIIVSIDGKPIAAGQDLTELLNGPPNRDVTLKVKGSPEREVILRPISFPQARTLLYDQWLTDNRKAVEQKSGGALGYLHIAAMDMTSFYKFEEQLYAAGAGKDGLLIDVRENGGGSTADHLLTALTQPVHATTVPRGGGPGYPNDRKVYASWNKPIVVLCNQNSFSNAEIFSHAIKSLQRGKLVGVPTAGGVISTGGVPIMDVGFLRLPFRGWFVAGDGQDMELNGAKPDFVVWPEPGQLARGQDVQLNKAVAVLLDDVKAWKSRPQPKLMKATERAPAKE